MDDGLLLIGRKALAASPRVPDTQATTTKTATPSCLQVVRITQSRARTNHPFGFGLPTRLRTRPLNHTTPPQKACARLAAGLLRVLRTRAYSRSWRAWRAPPATRPAGFSGLASKSFKVAGAAGHHVGLEPAVQVRGPGSRAVRSAVRPRQCAKVTPCCTRDTRPKPLCKTLQPVERVRRLASSTRPKFISRMLAVWMHLKPKGASGFGARRRPRWFGLEILQNPVVRVRRGGTSRPAATCGEATHDTSHRYLSTSSSPLRLLNR